MIDNIPIWLKQVNQNTPTINPKIEIITLDDLIDKDEELAKLNKRLSELDSFILSIENKLSNDDFISKAPENIVSGEKNKLNDFLVERTKILSNIEVLK